MANLSKYFFESLPAYFKINDTYKVDGEGLLERYLSVFQAVSEQQVVDIEGIEDIQSPLTTLDKFIGYIAQYYGSPPDTFGDTDKYRILLANIIRINKLKGTSAGVQEFFKIMGVTATVAIEYAPSFRYDDDFVYDTPAIHYDAACYLCANVTIDVLDPTFIITQLNVGSLTDDTRRIVQSILLYLLPINTVIKEFKYNSVVKDISLTTNLVQLPIPGGPLP